MSRPTTGCGRENVIAIAVLCRHDRLLLFWLRGRARLLRVNRTESSAKQSNEEHLPAVIYPHPIPKVQARSTAMAQVRLMTLATGR